MKKGIVAIVWITLFLTACFPIRSIQPVTGEEAVQRLVESMPVLFNDPTGRRVIPCSETEPTMNEMTARISQCYIHQNTIAIGVILDSAGGKKYIPTSLSLAYATGAPLKSGIFTGVSGSSDSLGIRLPPGVQVEMLFFEDPHSPKIPIPFEGTLTLSYLERNLWHDLTKLGQPEKVGPFQFKITIPDQ